MAREASLHSKKNEELRALGVTVIAGDLKGPKEDLIRIFKGADVLISTVNAAVLPDQKVLADAAKEAGVGRFVPCSFATAAPPRGVMKLRETVSPANPPSSARGNLLDRKTLEKTNY